MFGSNVYMIEFIKFIQFIKAVATGQYMFSRTFSDTLGVVNRSVAWSYDVSFDLN